MVYAYMIYVSCSISLSFQLTVYGHGHLCPAAPVPGVDATDRQGEYYDEDYGGSDGWGLEVEAPRFYL